MKKIWFVAVLLVSQNILAGSMNHIKDSINKSVIKYEIIIQKENKNILKSVFEIKTGVEFVILSKEVGNKNKTINSKTGVMNEEVMIKSVEIDDLSFGEMEQLTVIANVGLNNNIYSEFSWKIVDLANAKKTFLLLQENNATVIEENPFIKTNENKTRISHSKNKAVFFILNNQEFTIRATY